MNTNEAIKELQRNYIFTNKNTLVSWIIFHDLGSKPKGKWEVDPDKLKQFIKNCFRKRLVYRGQNNEKERC